MGTCHPKYKSTSIHAQDSWGLISAVTGGVLGALNLQVGFRGRDPNTEDPKQAAPRGRSRSLSQVPLADPPFWAVKVALVWCWV